MLGRIVVHGGAGFWRKYIRRGLAGVGDATCAGVEVLQRGGTALDAVEAAIVVLEDNSVFNAGRGSALTSAGTVEMDAALMDGRDLSAGAVALLHKVKNPILLARVVMEKTDHVLLAGAEAEELAKAFSLPFNNPITRQRQKMLLDVKKGVKNSRNRWTDKNLKLFAEDHKFTVKDTVGAVAVDSQGNFAAGASTGGVTMKLPGRIGDTPQIGSGLYADNQAGAATVTGLGEVAIKLVLSKTVCLMMQRGATAEAAAARAVQTASKRLKGEAGVIAIDRSGRIAAVHNTPLMPWAFSSTQMSKPRVRQHGKIITRVRL